MLHSWDMSQPVAIQRLLGLIAALDAQGAVVSETRIVKSAYLLESMYGLPMGFNWILYKHGPYTREVNDALVGMSKGGLISIRPRKQRGIEVSVSASAMNALPTEDLLTINAVAEKVATLDVGELERLSTAAWISKRMTKADASVRAGYLCKWKPHVASATAVRAIKFHDRLQHEIAERKQRLPDPERMSALAQITRNFYPPSGPIHIYTPR